METLFKISFTRDKDWAQDVSRYVFFRRPIMIVIDVYCVLSLIFVIWNLAVDYSYLNSAICSLLIIAFIELLIVFRYRQTVKLTLKRDIEMHGKQIEITATVTKELISYENSSGSQCHLHYSDIKKVAQTKKYIYLYSKANVYYSFKKDAFSVGTAEEFLQFLKNKGIR